VRDGLQALTEKEKQTLRLLLAGHDAKSMARALDLSVHTVNERLRHARRKLSAPSSREAARLLRESEGAHPQSFGDKALGDASGALRRQQENKPETGWSRRKLWPIGGFAMISLSLAMLALTASPQAASERATTTVAESAAVRAAMQWLALVDAAKWQESFVGTTASFQSQNTVQMWQSASEQARVPLGRMISRTAVSDESVPTPPQGHRVVRFRTDFANKKGAIETVSLAREGESWRIAGIYID
jgi:DNA-binding CsgD family transcriptional regulator